MLKGTKEFYDKVKLKWILENSGDPSPITHTHVFYKEYPRLPSVDLPKIADFDDLETLLEMRESTRVFSDKPLNLEYLSRIIRSCRIVDSKRSPEKRTYPSGGARFPVELYVISLNVEGLSSGAYHYNIRRESLENLWNKDLRNKQRELISPYLENPAAIVIFTSVMARSEVKYGFRAYPYSLIEAGHMGQNIHLTCTKLGVGSCSVSGFVDTSVKEILDLTNDEIPIYSISMGWKKRF